MIEIVFALMDIFGFIIQYPVVWGFIFCLIFFISQAQWDANDHRNNLFNSEVKRSSKTNGTTSDQKPN